MWSKAWQITRAGVDVAMIILSGVGVYVVGFLSASSPMEAGTLLFIAGCSLAGLLLGGYALWAEKTGDGMMPMGWAIGAYVAGYYFVPALESILTSGQTLQTIGPWSGS